MPVALSGASGASDGAGHVLVFGGKTALGIPVNTVYRYTIATSTWDVRSPMPVAVSDAAVVYGFYGSIYVADGKSTSGAVANFSNITVGAGASLVVMNPIAGSPQTIVDTSSLSIAGSVGAWMGTLDLGRNDLIVNNTAGTVGGELANLTDQLASGYANGTWTGTGIQSSAAATDTSALTTLGIMQNSTASTFDGQAADSNSLLIKYTYYGDATLDGVADGSDYSRIDSVVLSGASGWNNGDFNYDGVVDGSDYTLIDNACNTQGASLAARIASPAAIVNRAVPPNYFFTIHNAHRDRRFNGRSAEKEKGCAGRAA